MLVNYNCFEYQSITSSAPESGREVKGRINMLKEKEVAMNVYVLGLFSFLYFFFSKRTLPGQMNGFWILVFSLFSS